MAGGGDRAESLAWLLLAIRDIWGPDRLTPARTTVVLTVVLGDIARHARGVMERGELDREDLGRELANLAASALRAIMDLDLQVDKCLTDALRSQREYQQRRGHERTE